MKKLLLLALLASSVSVLGFGQSYNINIGGLPISSGAAVPSSCAREGSLFFKTTATKSWYFCTGGTYTAFGTGSGSGDFSGPGSATSGDLVSFNGTGGKTGQDSGVASANVVTAASNYTNNALAKAAGANKTTSSSLATDDGTTLTYTGTGGISAPSVTVTGTASQDIFAEMAAPANPNSGFGHGWFDSTSHNYEASNSDGKKFAMGPVTDTANIGYWFPALAISAPTAQAIVASADQVRATQVFLPGKLKVTKISARISGTVAASTITACLYTIDGNTKLIDSGTFDGNSAAVQTKTITAVTLSPGWYWFAQTASTQTTLTAFAFPNDATLNGFINAQATKKQGLAANAAASGVCPSTLGAISATNYTILATDFEP